MSEEERKRRFGYRQSRKKRITLLTNVLVVLLIFTLLFAVMAVVFNKTYYVSYTEKSSVKYGVHLKDNDFYEDTYLDEGYAYIASLIDSVEACFNYGMVMNTESDVSFKYTYRIDSILEIRDRNTGKLLFAPTYNEVEESTKQILGDSVDVSQIVYLDYNKYNKLADSFVRTYQLNNIQATLNVKMHVSVLGASAEFHDDESSRSYVSSISIPLVTNTLSINITSAPPAVQEKILSYTTKGVADVFKTLSITFGLLSVATLILLILYTYLSRNFDITYDIKIKRILSAYKPYIQRIQNEYDTSGHQVLKLLTFNEMLDIHDTIQSPILMFENDDRTCSKFFIISNSSVVYLYEIKVDDYDTIYNTDNGGSEAIAENTDTVIIQAEAQTEKAFEEIVKTEAAPVPEVKEEVSYDSVIEQVKVTEEAFKQETATDEAEPKAPEISIIDSIIENAIELDNENGDEDGDSAIAYLDEAGNLVKITCARSFTANLIQSNPQVKYYYNEIKNHLLSYKGVKSRISWRLESYNKGRTQLAKLKIRGKTICLYCALNPDEFDRTKFFHEHTTAKMFSKVPMMVRIKSDRGLKKAKLLIDTVMNNFGIVTNSSAETVDYASEYPYDTTKNLVVRKLIKILLPDATAAEPKAHHHVHKKTFEVVTEDEVDEIVLFETDGITEEDISEVIEAPTPELEEIDYVDLPDEEAEPVQNPEKQGVDVIGVVWPERASKNKIYRYDPDGEELSVGDIVIVPTRDAHRNREVIRKAAVAHSNYKAEPSSILHPLKKIIGVMHRKRLANTSESEHKTK